MKAYIRRRAVMCLALVLTVAQLAGNAAAAETEPDQKEEMHLVLDADVGRIGCNIASFDVGAVTINLGLISQAFSRQRKEKSPASAVIDEGSIFPS